MIDWRPTRVEARGSAAQRAGLYYERKVVRHFDLEYLCAVQPTMVDGRGRKRRPDLLVFDRECFECVVVEVKYSFTVEAFAQLERYASIVKSELPWVRVGTLVVCKNYDVGVAAPFSPRLVEETQLFNLSRKPCAVMVLSEREMRVGRYGLRMGGRTSPGTVWESGGTWNTFRSGGELSSMAVKARAR